MGQKVVFYSEAFSQAVFNAVNGKKSFHLIILGFPRSGTTLLYNMIRSVVPSTVYCPPCEISSLKTRKIKEKGLVTKRPLDMFQVDQIISSLASFRDLQFLVSLRDPRDLVSSFHISAPNQFFQGYDYHFFIHGSIKSYTKPGVGAVHNEILRFRQRGYAQALFVKYEQLTENPQKIQQKVQSKFHLPMNGNFSDFHKAEIPEDLRQAMNSVRQVDEIDRPAWTEPGRLARVAQQMMLFPELEDCALSLGYPPYEDVLESLGLSAPEVSVQTGKIILFHTDDELYNAEAQRCICRLEKLTLSYDRSVISSQGDWAQNCAYKPQILLDARKRLRGPLLYVDVDAIVHQNPWPYLSQYNGDIATYIHNDGELMSGTIWLNDTVGARRVLEAWVETQKASPRTYDQRVLQCLIENEEKNIQRKRWIFQRLPPNLTYVFDKNYEFFYGDVIVEHLQASRQIKYPDSPANQERKKRIEELSK